MQGRFPPITQRRYPGLLQKDALLWDQFLEKWGKHYDSFDYNVRVGEGAKVNENLPGYIKYMAKALTQKRIDAVGYSRGEIWLIEVTGYARVGTLGQVEAYQELYLETFQPAEPIQAAIVCHYADRDLARLYVQRGISLFVLPYSG